MLGSSNSTQLTMPVAPAYSNNGGVFGGNGIDDIIGLAILGLFFGGGNGGLFGGGNTAQYEALNANMQRGFDNQNIMSQFATISANQTNAAYENAQLINNSTMAGMQNTFTLSNAMNSGFNGVTSGLNSGFDGVQLAINNLSHQLSDCCCSLKTQMLQDKYDAAQNQLNLAQIASANAVQTDNILNTMGRWYANQAYGCGCGCNCQ